MSLDSAGASRGCFPPAASMAASGPSFRLHLRPATAPAWCWAGPGGGRPLAGPQPAGTRAQGPAGGLDCSSPSPHASGHRRLLGMESCLQVEEP